MERSGREEHAHAHVSLRRVARNDVIHLQGAEFTAVSETEDRWFYFCFNMNLHCEIREVAPPPVLTVNVKAGEEHISVEVTMTSGKTVFDCEYPKTGVPTYAALKKEMTSHLMQENIITAQQTIRLVLCSGEEPAPRRKVWTKRTRGY